MCNTKNKKFLDIPNKWFFFNPTVVSSKKVFYKISNKIGVVFFFENLTLDKFFKLIEPYVLWCNKNKIKFIIPYSIYWANKYKAYGILLDAKCRKKGEGKNLKFLRKKFFFASKVHNVKEAMNIRDFTDLVFLSPVFKTKSYLNKIPLTKYIFISLCFFFKEKMIFVLGGVNYKNFNFIKNSKVYGFGAINFFKDGK
jgi:thiamine monophosphate synthase